MDPLYNGVTYKIQLWVPRGSPEGRCLAGGSLPRRRVPGDAEGREGNRRSHACDTGVTPV